MICADVKVTVTDVIAKERETIDEEVRDVSSSAKSTWWVIEQAGHLKAKSWFWLFEILVLFLTEILSMKAIPSTDSPSATPVDEPSVSEARKTVTWILLKSFEYIYICDEDYLGRW